MDENRAFVSRLMSEDVLTVTPQTPIETAASKMLESGVGSLVVVDTENRPAGMLTTTDLAGVVSAGDVGGDTPVERYMTDVVHTVGERSSIREAAARMITNDVHHLPVTNDGGTVVGMLSTMDLTVYLTHTKAVDTD